MAGFKWLYVNQSSARLQVWGPKFRPNEKMPKVLGMRRKKFIVKNEMFMLLWIFISLFNPLTPHFDQSAGAVEYTDCTSAEGYDPPPMGPGYDTKQSDDKVSVMLELW